MPKQAFLLTHLSNMVESCPICAAADRDAYRTELCVGQKIQLIQENSEIANYMLCRFNSGYLITSVSSASQFKCSFFFHYLPHQQRGGGGL